MGPFDAATVRRFVTLGQWKAAARKAKDEPTAEIASGVTLRDAVIVLRKEGKGAQRQFGRGRVVDLRIASVEWRPGGFH